MGLDMNANLPKGVVIGGGTGAPASIKALLSLGFDTTAVVAMADDGGSTGLLRDKADVTPPGDIRKCLVAMASDPDDPMVQAFRTRFKFADNHALGNLVLAALEQSTGSFPEAIRLCADLLHARGTVLPSTLSKVWLKAVTRDGHSLVGQANACSSNIALRRVSLLCDGPLEPYQPALDAIRNADLVVIGPGSLYTSIIPNLLIPGVIDAIRDSKAPTLFVASLADFQGETGGMTSIEHLQALFDHGMKDLVDFMLIHDYALRPLGVAVKPVLLGKGGLDRIRAMGVCPVVMDVVDQNCVSRHDPVLLAQAVQEVQALCHSRKR